MELIINAFLHFMVIDDLNVAGMAVLEAVSFPLFMAIAVFPGGVKFIV
jgi:hypothetical protein